MGLEGSVRLGCRKELAAIENPGERERVAELYEHGKAVNAAAALEIDAVIDPADSRAWILSALDGRSPDDTAPAAAPGGRRPFVAPGERAAAGGARGPGRLHGTARSGGPIS